MKAFLLLLAVSAAHAQRYTFVDFEAAGATAATPTAINNAGQVLGTYVSASGTHCFLRSPDGTITSFDPPGANFTCAGLNNLGQAVGTFSEANIARGYIRSATGEFTRFDFAGGGYGGPQGPGAAATAINDRGEVSGTFASPPYGGPAFVRSADGVITPVQGATVGQIMPTAINNRGDLAGWMLIGSSLGTQHGFLRGSDGVVRKFDLPGTTTYTRIAALSNTGQFAGAMVGGPGFVSNPDGSFTLLPGYTVTGLNDQGMIVGTRFVGGVTRGFIGTPAAGATASEIRTELPGVLTASAFGGSRTIAPGTWIEIYGRNLAPRTRAWTASDFVGDRAPTSLEGVQVTVGGLAAVVSYVSPGQVNAFVPAEVVAGTAEVTVANGSAITPPYPVTVNAWQPSMLTLPPDIDPRSAYVAALFPDFATYALPDFLPYYGVPHRRAKAGDTLIFIGQGFGPGKVEFLFSRSQPAVAGTVAYAGSMPGTIGLWQFNLVLPDVPLLPGETSDDYVAVEVKVDGQPIPTPPFLRIAVGK
jgi:uncharacterized protein (TIGR03437 family)